MRWLVTLCALGVCAACGESATEERSDVWETPPGAVAGPAPLSSAPATEKDDVAVGPCKHDQKRECKVTLKVRNGIRTCALGEQRCEGGNWGECKSKPAAPGKLEDGSGGAAGAESK